jgi:uncharacterized protein
VVITGVTLLFAVGLYAAVCMAYWALQERIIFVRFRLSKGYRFRFPQPYAEELLETGDGAFLHALRFVATEPKGLVIYFHGNTGSLRRWGKRAPRFINCGYEVLMPDPRGYGKSRGKLSEQALHADAQRWYEHACKTWPQERIVLYGRSLGSGLATPLAAANRPAALVLESPFANLFDAASRYSILLPYRLLLRYHFRNDVAVAKVKCPVYILHGKRDLTVPYASALKLYAAIPPSVPREMVTFPGGGHSDLARYARYGRKLRQWLAAAAVRAEKPS